MPPPASPSHGADDPEVSSRRISPDPPRPEVDTSIAQSLEYPAPKRELQEESGIVEHTAGHTNGPFVATGHLGDTLCLNGYGG